MADTYLDQLLGDGRKRSFCDAAALAGAGGRDPLGSRASRCPGRAHQLLLALVPAFVPWGGAGLPAAPAAHHEPGARRGHWANHKFVVTNRRILHVEGVLDKDITDSSLEKVNDAKLEQSMWGRRMLDFGNVEILTASELGVNKFHQIAGHDPVQDGHAQRQEPAGAAGGERG